MTVTQFLFITIIRFSRFRIRLFFYERPCSDSDMLRRLINCRIIIIIIIIIAPASTKPQAKN